MASKSIVYGTLILAATLGIAFRTIYLMNYPLEDPTVSKRLPLTFFFTQIKIINKYMLFWPLTQIVVFYITLLATAKSELDKKIVQSYTKKVVVKWFLSYFLFLIYFYGFMFMTGSGKADFDPSGHLTCAMVAQNQYLMPLLFFI